MDKIISAKIKKQLDIILDLKWRIGNPIMKMKFF